jgi:hypothetical protein
LEGKLLLVPLFPLPSPSPTDFDHDHLFCYSVLFPEKGIIVIRTIEKVVAIVAEYKVISV